MDTNIKTSVIDIFCGIGGLSHGLIQSGLNVKAGVDFNLTCKYPFEKNNSAEFIHSDISDLDGVALGSKYWEKHTIKILVGCAPCQPFSTHSNKIRKDKRINNEKWSLLNQFSRLVYEMDPDIISMENVTNLTNQKVFEDCVTKLESLGYYISYQNVYCPNYGIPQKRRRVVLLGSKLGEIKFLEKELLPLEYKTTRDVIGHLEKLKDGEKSKFDPLHFASKLSEINLIRIKSSKPNGTWLDWDENLRLKCHKKSTGKSFKSVYGRMSWDEPSPTITTQFYNYGTGRFGHPDQDRAVTIREAALLQTFPEDYIFTKENEEVRRSILGQQIGNAVPVKLGYVIGKSILNHLNSNLS